MAPTLEAIAVQILMTTTAARIATTAIAVVGGMVPALVPRRPVLGLPIRRHDFDSPAGKSIDGQLMWLLPAQDHTDSKIGMCPGDMNKHPIIEKVWALIDEFNGFTKNTQ